MNTADTPAGGKPARIYATVNFDNPVTISGEEVTKVRLRKPKAGEMRGLIPQQLFQMDVGAVGKLVSRISEPMLTEQDVYDLEPEDFISLAGEVIGFLLSKSAKAEAGLDA